MFSSLYINIPVLDAITRILSFAKFLKDIISNKRKVYEVNKPLKNFVVVHAIRALHKRKDAGAMVVNCRIGNLCINRALCDSGAGINLMPLSVYQRLNLGPLIPSGWCV